MGAVRLLILLICFSWPGSGPALAGKRVALVIGNSAYQKVPGLPNTANDAAALASMFMAAHFESVDSKFDLSVAALRKTLREFEDKTRDADIAVVYYAGHGIELDGNNFLVPTDAALETDSDVLDETVSLERVLFAVEPAKRLRLVILDACRDNPFVKTMRRTVTSRGIWRGLAKVEPMTPNTLIAFAAKAGSTASDGDARNSPFATALVEYLPKPGLDIRRALGFVRDDVLKSTQNKQEPYVYGSLGGDDAALVPAIAPLAPFQPDLKSAIRRDYELALQLATRDGWNAFLSQYPDGFYANLAQGQLNKIVSEDRAAAAERARLAEQVNGEIKVAALSPPSQQQTRFDLSRALQDELRRVGCSRGGVDGQWSAASERALRLFNIHAGTGFDTKAASAEALDAVKDKTGRICPLACDTGYRANGDQCVKMTCRTGYKVNDVGSCEKVRVKRVVGKSDRPRQKLDARHGARVDTAPLSPQAAANCRLEAGWRVRGGQFNRNIVCD